MNIDVLKKTYLFQDMTGDELSKITKLCREREVIAGQDVFFKGQKAESLVVILQGSFKIFRTTDEGDDIQISSLSSGSTFGEMAFITGDDRTATAKALENSRLIEIPFGDFNGMLAKEAALSDKFHRALSKFLANRLKATTSDLSEAKQTLLRHF